MSISSPGGFPMAASGHNIKQAMWRAGAYGLTAGPQSVYFLCKKTVAVLAQRS
jgi:hypothetical protein